MSSKPHKSWYVYQARRVNESNFYDITAPVPCVRGLAESLNEYRQGVIEEPSSEHRIVVVSRTVVLTTEQVDKSENVVF